MSRGESAFMAGDDFQRPARQLTPSACEREITLGCIWPLKPRPARLKEFPPLTNSVLSLSENRFAPSCSGVHFAMCSAQLNRGDLNHYGFRSNIHRWLRH